MRGAGRLRVGRTRCQEVVVVVQEVVMAVPVLKAGHKVMLVQELVLAVPALKVVM